MGGSALYSHPSTVDEALCLPKRILGDVISFAFNS